jgi:FAD/FMN-containing dehydrogenase/Fe-S oxidoreductase
MLREGTCSPRKVQPMRDEIPASPQRVSVNGRLKQRLERALEGSVAFDLGTRGRYATDASIYQITPAGVVFPRTDSDVAATLALAAEEGVPVIARGGGTSQNGQPLGTGLVIDFSRHLGGVLDLQPERETVRVRPGTVLQQLNARLRKDGLFFPVEPSTASRCTIGGMTANNSSGARSIFYGKMSDRVLRIEGLGADGTRLTADHELSDLVIADRVTALARAERTEIASRFPKVQRRVGGYNLDALLPEPPNFAALLTGSEGTLALSTAITLKLARLPAHRVMGVCHFPSFRAAMETTRHLVALGPVAVELVDNNVLTLGAELPDVARTLGRITRGNPDCLLLVEFAGDDRAALESDLRRLDECMADHGFPNSVVTVTDPTAQTEVWAVREACLNIMMSMKGDGKPVSFIEDCAVPLEHLADYTEAITDLFARHGTRGTWYAHASVGCLHVRPILNMKTADGVRAMRAIAEEAFDLVRRFEGSHSGEHGDGISRSEFHEGMFGSRLVRAFEGVKDAFDPHNRLNPGKIVRPLAMDDRSLMRFPEGYSTPEPARTALDWSAWGGFGGAVEMCNNNGTCRKLAGGAMCPSYRATRDERHVTRGRANTLRLAISGQLGPDAFTSDEVKDTLDLCVSCKACRRECPTGVDMAKMKIEFLHAYHARHGLPLRERVVAELPRYAPAASRLRALLNLRNRVPVLARLSERTLGFSARRSLPVWRRPWREPKPSPAAAVQGDGRDLVLFGDTFNRYFEPENLRAATSVLDWVDKARAEAARTLAALKPYVDNGARIVGLEPSCLLTMRDEFHALLPGDDTAALSKAALMVEEAMAADLDQMPAFPDAGGRVAHLHGHCHQKSFGVMGAVETVLRAVPGLDLRPIESSCCGMAGAFGYRAEHIETSFAMGELSLLPAVRAAAPDDLVVADGTSCRHQIKDGTGREARHVVVALAEMLGLADTRGPATERPA